MKLRFLPIILPLLVVNSLGDVVSAAKKRKKKSDTIHRQWPLRSTSGNDDDDSIPASFDCLMRKAAYQFGKHIQPRHGAFDSLYYALDLNSETCHEELSPPSDDDFNINNVDTEEARRQLLNEELLSSSDVIYVALDGKDDVVGSNFRGSNTAFDPSAMTTIRHQIPFRSIQVALDFAAVHSVSHVVVREGVYYLKETLSLTSLHSNLTITAYPGEEVVLSGGIPLNDDDIGGGLHWEPYDTDGNKNIWVTEIKENPPLEGFPGLQIDGKRATRSRYPNLPGGIEVSCGYGCMIKGDDAIWTPPEFDKYGNTTYYTDELPAHTRPNAGWFEHYTIGTHGLCDVYDPPVSYWCSDHTAGGGAFPFRTPSGMTPKNSSVLPNAPYANTDDAVVFVWRPGRWANWMMKIANYDSKTGNMTFGAGGNQGARGNNKGGDWFIENLMEELDAPGEFYYDQKSHKLYLFYNGTGAPPEDTDFVVPQLRTLVNMTGTQWDPVQDITFRGITFRSSRYTYMDPHGVPGGGDWALERNGAVFLQGTEKTLIDQCIFDRLDGNGLMISGYNRRTVVRHSDFSFLGGTAIASWGYTNETDTDPGRPGIQLENAPAAGIDGTDGEHPRYTAILECTAREVGLYEKQASFYMQAKTAYTSLVGNVFFNGPRAGINFNDGFGGGDEIIRNLVFSTCRESGDHGPLNSWDRQPFLTIKDGRKSKPSMDMEWRLIHHNFLIDNYSPQECVDNDDGSRYFKTYANFMVYGSTGMKNDFGGHDNRHSNNIYAYVGSALRISIGSDQLKGHEDHFVENKVVMTGQDVGSFNCSQDYYDGAPVMHSNQYYTPNGTINECEMSLAEWQKLGHDTHSTVSKLPSDEDIIQWARDLLDF